MHCLQRAWYQQDSVYNQLFQLHFGTVQMDKLCNRLSYQQYHYLSHHSKKYHLRCPNSALYLLDNLYMQFVGFGVGIHQVGIQYNQLLHLQHCYLSHHPMGHHHCYESLERCQQANAGSSLILVFVQMDKLYNFSIMYFPSLAASHRIVPATKYTSWFAFTVFSLGKLRNHHDIGRPACCTFLQYLLHTVCPSSF